MKYRTFTRALLLVAALLTGAAFAADKAAEFVPDDDKGPDIGAAPTDSTDASKGKKVSTEQKKAEEFVPDDDKGPDIGAAPAK